MNPFILQMLGSFARIAIVWIAAKLGTEVSQDEATKIFLEYLVPMAVAVWTVWKNYKGRQKLNVALSSNTPMTEHEVEAVVKTNPQAVPSVATPKHEVPQPVETK